MKQVFVFFILVVFAPFCVKANYIAPKSLDAKGLTKERWGDCLKLVSYLPNCQKFSCIMPKDPARHIWHTKQIKGYLNNKCLVVEYDYQGRNIVSKPLYCQYNYIQRNSLASNIASLTSLNSMLNILDVEESIKTMKKDICVHKYN